MPVKLERCKSLQIRYNYIVLIIKGEMSVNFDLSKMTTRNPQSNRIEEIKLDNIVDHRILSELASLIIADKHHDQFDIESFILRHSYLDEHEYSALYQLLEHCDHLKSI